jgi:hypothetical protein
MRVVYGFLGTLRNLNLPLNTLRTDFRAYTVPLTQSLEVCRIAKNEICEVSMTSDLGAVVNNPEKVGE